MAPFSPSLWLCILLTNLVAAVEVIRAQPDGWNVQARWVANQVVALYQAWERPDQAEKYRELIQQRDPED